MTRGPLVGSVRSHFLEDLYEQCSFHIAEKMPSSVSDGARPISARMRSYSSGFRPWAATSAGVIGSGAGGSRRVAAAGVTRLSSGWLPDRLAPGDSWEVRWPW